MSKFEARIELISTLKLSAANKFILQALAIIEENNLTFEQYFGEIRKNDIRKKTIC